MEVAFTHKVLIVLGTTTFKRARVLADQVGLPLDEFLTNVLTEGLAPQESKHGTAPIPEDTPSS